MQRHERAGLYDPAYERDSCGFGLIANLDDQPSHWLVRTAITSLNRLTHRGAIAADGKTGDGCGLLLKRPEQFPARRREGGRHRACRARSPPASCSLESEDQAATRCRARRLEAQLEREGLELAGWRVVPTDPDACGAEALKTLPRIEQVFVNCRARHSTRPRSTASCSSRAAARRRRSRTKRPGVLHAEPVGQHARLQGHGDAAAPGGVLPGPRGSRGSRPRWRCSTSASRPTRCRSGASRIRTAISRTTARSTPSQGNRSWAVARGPAVSLAAAARPHRHPAAGVAARARIRRASTTCSRCC